MKLPTSGIIYYAHYLRWHHDKNPLVFILHSDNKMTHALNLHYFSKTNYERLAQLFIKLKDEERASILFKTDKHRFYHSWLKKHFGDVIEQCYRTYFTGLLMCVPVTRMAMLEIGKLITVKQDTMPRTTKHNKLRRKGREDRDLWRLMHHYNSFRKNSQTLQRIKAQKQLITGKVKK